MKITKELSQIAYKISKKVFDGNLSFKDGQEKLVQENGMNPNSAADFIHSFKYLLAGNRFTRTHNAYSMAYLFENIHKDYGITGLANALTALKLHIEYYEGLRKVRMHKMREIYEKYLTVPIDTPDEQEQTEFISEFRRQNKSKEEIANELKNLKPTDTEEIIINGKSFKRNNRTVAQIKFLRDSKCQICSTTIRKKDGSYYIEAAHIKPKHQKGCETPDNIILLCPNHHKEFDLGDLTILKQDSNRIEFILNGDNHAVSLKID